MKQMGKLSAEERPVIGQLANEIRADIEKKIAEKSAQIKEAELKHRLENEAIDVTMPGKEPEIGHKHPLSIVLDEIKEIFMGMGFDVAEGPEVEYDYYNFEALNIPKGHPARDTQDTFYIDDNIVLRTQTSPIQIRYMEKHEPPFRMIAPGRVFRSDAVDATHSPLFHQIEGLVVDKGVTMADLKGTLEAFAKRLYGENTKSDFAPTTFLSRSRAAKSTFPALNAAARAARCARARVGLKFSAAAWCIPRCLKTAVLTLRSTAALHSAWALKGLLCSAST